MPRRFRDFFSNPGFGILGSVASLVALPLSLYLYFASLRSPELTFQISSARTSIVRAVDLAQLSVSFEGREVPGDISAAQVAIWNAGKAPIRGEDLLEPVSLELGVPILQASLSRSSRSATQMAVDIRPGAVGSVGVSWKILEQDDFGVLQILYQGPVDRPIRMAGQIVGQKQIAERPWASAARIEVVKYLIYQVAVLGVLLLLVTVKRVMWLRATRAALTDASEPYSERGSPALKAWWVIVNIIILLVVLAAALLWRAVSGQPPVGFS